MSRGSGSGGDGAAMLSVAFESLHLIALLLLLNRFLCRGSADRWAGEKCPQVVGHALSLLFPGYSFLMKHENFINFGKTNNLNPILTVHHDFSRVFHLHGKKFKGLLNPAALLPWCSSVTEIVLFACGRATV